MFVSVIKNYIREWTIWLWLLFISLLASEAELLPKLQTERERAETQDEIQANNKNNIKFKNDFKEESYDDLKELQENNYSPDDESVKLNKQNLIAPQIIIEDEYQNKTKNDSTSEEQEDECYVGSLTLGKCEQGNVSQFSPDMKPLEENTEDNESEEKLEDNDDNIELPWIGSGRGTGLTRYSGVQNLVTHTESENEEISSKIPPTIQKDEEILLPPTQKVVTTLCPDKFASAGHSRHSQNSSRESLIDEFGNDHPDEIWAKLVAQYTDAYDDVHDRPNKLIYTDKTKFGAPNWDITGDLLTDHTNDPPTMYDKNMTSTVFSDTVNKRLQMYLQRLDDNEDENKVYDDISTKKVENTEHNLEELNSKNASNIKCYMPDKISSDSDSKTLPTSENKFVTDNTKFRQPDEQRPESQRPINLLSPALLPSIREISSEESTGPSENSFTKSEENIPEKEILENQESSLEENFQKDKFIATKNIHENDDTDAVFLESNNNKNELEIEPIVVLDEITSEDQSYDKLNEQSTNSQFDDTNLTDLKSQNIDDENKDKHLNLSLQAKDETCIDDEIEPKVIQTTKVTAETHSDENHDVKQTEEDQRTGILYSDENEEDLSSATECGSYTKSNKESFDIECEEDLDGAYSKPNEWICDLLTNSEQNLVAKILAQKSIDDPHNISNDKLERSIWETYEPDYEIDEDLNVTNNPMSYMFDISDQAKAENSSNFSTKSTTKPDYDVDFHTNLVPDTDTLHQEKRNLHDISNDEIPEYLSDVKDLLIPKVRRKRGNKRSKIISDILKIDGNDEVVKYEGNAYDDNVHGESVLEMEENEQERLNCERELYRAEQRRELQQYLSMPDALTSDEQKELEELLEDEESEKVVNAATEARLEILLTEVRKRIAKSHEVEEDTDLDKYMSLPIALSEEESMLLSDSNERSKIEDEEIYRDYITQKFLEDLERDKLRLTEDYFTNEYFGHELMNFPENYPEHQTPTPTKDEAVGTDEPLNVKAKPDKGKKLFNLSLFRKKENHDDKTDEDKNHSDQSKKFFRYGSLSIKRKKKNKDLEEPKCTEYNSEQVDSSTMNSINLISNNLEDSTQNSYETEVIPQQIYSPNQRIKFLKFCSFNSDSTSSENSDKQFVKPRSINTSDEWEVVNNSDSCMSDDSFVLLNSESLNKNVNELLDLGTKNQSFEKIENFITNENQSESNVVKSNINTELNDCTMPRKTATEATEKPAVNGKAEPKTKKKEKLDQTAWPDEKKPKAVLDEFQKMEQEIIQEVENEKKKKDPQKKKKKKKSEAEKENKKSAYENKDALLDKHLGPRVRSFDAAKMKDKFNKPKESSQMSNECRNCGKQVFQMEKIVAEKSAWHKNCFRCKECNKNLSLENYQSHEGSLYCKPHFKELFRPKVVVQDEEQERKERLMRKPRMIILESNPQELPEDVVRATEKPDYGLEELQKTLNVKERYEIFESYSKEEEAPPPEPISVRRSQSLMSKAAKFMADGETDLNGFHEESEEEEEEEDQEEDEEGDVHVVRSSKKKERPMSFSGMGDLKAAWEQKQRREEMSQARKEEVAKFRQLLCAGKNLSLKEKFENGKFDEEEEFEKTPSREEIKIEGRRAASNLRKKFEQGQPFISEEDEVNGDGPEMNGHHNRSVVSEIHEVKEIFKDAETAKKARNVFKQIDSKAAEEGVNMMRSASMTSVKKENRRSMDVSVLAQECQTAPVEVIKSSDKTDDFQVDTTDLANRFRFFMNYEKDKAKETESNRKVFRITPPREGIDQVEDVALNIAISKPRTCMAINCEACKFLRPEGFESMELLGRDPNLIKCTDNYQDEVDCRNTKNILQMFRKMEMGDNEEKSPDDGPRPLKCFTPPLDARDEEEDSEEYTDEEYTDEDEDEMGISRPELRDEILQMLTAKKAAGLRAKFEKWETATTDDRERPEDEEMMPSLDTAKNLKAMFENKVTDTTKVATSKPVAQKINRFV